MPDGVRCGISRCGEVVGHLEVDRRGIQYVRLLEGFLRGNDGYFALHVHAAKRYKMGLVPRDAHGRWIETLGGDDPQRLRYSETVELEKVQVKCPKCGFLNWGS